MNFKYRLGTNTRNGFIISVNISERRKQCRRNRQIRGDRPGRNSASGSLRGPLEKNQKRRARVCAGPHVWRERVSRAPLPRCIPHARGRAIKRMQIKTFYLNDNITLVDASALA